MTSISDVLRTYDHDSKTLRAVYRHDAVAWATTKSSSSRVSGNTILLETEIALEELEGGPIEDTRENSNSN